MSYILYINNKPICVPVHTQSQLKDYPLTICQSSKIYASIINNVDRVILTRGKLYPVFHIQGEIFPLKWKPKIIEETPVSIEYSKCIRDAYVDWCMSGVYLIPTPCMWSISTQPTAYALHDIQTTLDYLKVVPKSGEIIYIQPIEQK